MLFQRLKFTVAYEGSAFCGWQIQAQSPSVQEHLEKALETFTGRPTRLHGSGRTDSGVHALGQVFHADIPTQLQIPCERWPSAFNTRLPATIRILKAEKVSSDFHARFSAETKTYRYKLICSPILLPQDFGRAGHYKFPLDQELFLKTLQEFVGTHDFFSFAATRGNEPLEPAPDYFVRTITQIEVTQEEPSSFSITLSGTGFLYKMVRLIIGTACAVASQKLDFEDFCELLHAPKGQKTKYCAPPEGLTLLSVQYPEEETSLSQKE